MVGCGGGGGSSTSPSTQTSTETTVTTTSVTEAKNNAQAASKLNSIDFTRFQSTLQGNTKTTINQKNLIEL